MIKPMIKIGLIILTILIININLIDIRAEVQDPYINLQWGIKNNGTFIDQFNTKSISNMDMNITKAWNKYSGGKEVIVAVIDTGIDYTHEDLKTVMWTNKAEIPDDRVDNDNNGYIDDIYGWNFSENSNITYNKQNEEDHGTHIAGIIAATQNEYGIAGVASNSNIKIMTLKILDTKYETGTIESCIDAIKYAEKMGASICNISSVIYVNDDKLKNAINKSNMLFVAAAGNGYWENCGINIDIDQVYPASYDSNNIISVANIGCDGKLSLSSNYGIKYVDIAAPGDSIWSTLANNKYGYYSGTSMATAMITGVVAMVYSYYDDITLLDTKNIILNSVKKLSSLEGKVSTGGIPDAYAAISFKKEDIILFDKESPIITVFQVKNKDTCHKILSVNVIENHLSLLKYVKGKRTKEYFHNKENGIKLKLYNNVVIIDVPNTSYYTIYAIDEAGNETIKVVKVYVK